MIWNGIMKIINDVGIVKNYSLPRCSESVCVGPLSDIYCNGKLIYITWLFGLQSTCPGEMLLRSPKEVLGDFYSLPNPIKRENFEKFCNRNFAKFPYLSSAELSDWTQEPYNIRLLNDTHLRNFTLKLNAIWKKLGRQFNPEVREKIHLFPVFPVPNPFIVPGGFFNIYFYWDSYWIIKGLLFSNMTLTSRNILNNFATVITHFNFIPNSGNIGLSRRTQPPLFVQMVADFYDATKNKTFLAEIMPFIETELSWWQQNRSISVDLPTGERYSLFRYNSISNCPRPENYLVDLDNGLNGTGDPEFIWSSIASACESGLDFSSRWFEYDGPHAGTKFSIRTNTVIPVDLNVFMAWNYFTVGNFFKILGKENKTKKYDILGKELKNAIQAVMWNDEDGIWYDYDLVKRQHRKRFYPSDVFPLLLGEVSDEIGSKILSYLESVQVLDFRGGIPSSLDKESEQQWDYPNGWAPTIHLFVESLRVSGHKQLQKLAKDIADKFIHTVYNGLMNTSQSLPSACWEKYDVRYEDGRPGNGGEYIVQQGFGWTNGAVLDMIRRFYILQSGHFDLDSKGYSIC
ncbi:unnamed protein product [Dracunculus medinensis]|uniref:Trehalase n=1 Tax=Dracunculus medinensis TaxID=318479 RepID=A0A0N4U6W2_DRAME|nr:unnamed protein product [Dracunculus medinensis]